MATMAMHSYREWWPSPRGTKSLAQGLGRATVARSGHSETNNVPGRGAGSKAESQVEEQSGAREGAEKAKGETKTAEKGRPRKLKRKQSEEWGEISK